MLEAICMYCEWFIRDVRWTQVLEAVPVLVLQRWDNQLLPLETENIDGDDDDQQRKTVAPRTEYSRRFPAS